MSSNIIHAVRNDQRYKTVAATEGSLDPRDALTEIQPCHPVAVGKGTVTDRAYTVGDGHRGNACSVLEGKRGDLGDAIGNGDIPCKCLRNEDKVHGSLFVYHAILNQEMLIVRRDIHHRKAGATTEGPSVHGGRRQNGQGCGQGDLRKRRTFREYTVSKLNQPVSHVYGRKGGAIVKRGITDHLDPVVQRDLLQGRTSPEGRICDLGHLLGYVDALETRAAAEGASSNTCHAVGQMDRSNTRIPLEPAVVDLRHALGNSHVTRNHRGQVNDPRCGLIVDDAVPDEEAGILRGDLHGSVGVECTLADDGNGGGQDVMGHARGIEALLTDIRQGLGEGNTRKPGHIPERKPFYAGDTLGKGQVSLQACTEMSTVYGVGYTAEPVGTSRQYGIRQGVRGGHIIEGIVVYGLHAMGDGQLLQPIQVIEATHADKGDPFGDCNPSEALGHVTSLGRIAARTEEIAQPGDPTILKALADEGDGDLLQLQALLENTDADHKIPVIGIGNGGRGDPVAHKGVCADVDEGIRSRKITADTRISKGVIVNALDAARVRHGDGGKLTAAVEGKIRDLHHGVGEHDVRKALTTVECTLVYTANQVLLGKDHRRQVITHGKGIVVNGDHAGRNTDLGNGIRIIESTVAKGQNIGVIEESDLRKTAILKGTEANDLNPCGQSHASLQACRYGDQLSSVLRQQHTVCRRIVGVILGHLKGGQLGQAHEGILTDIADVGGNIEALQSRPIEHVGHDHQVLTASQVHRPQFLDLSESIMIDRSHTVGDGDRSDMGIGKRLLGDLRHGEALGKCQRRNAAALEHGAAQGCDRLRNGHRLQALGLLEGGLLDGFDHGIGSKGQALDGRVGKGLTADKGHACGDGDCLQFGVVEGLRLDDPQGLGQYDRFHGAVRKCAAANIDDISAEIQFRQVNRRGRARVLNYGNISARQHGIHPIAVGDHVRHAQIVSRRAVIPVVGQGGGQSFSRKIQIYILRTQEGKATNVLQGGGEGDLGQIRTIVECISTHEGHALGDMEGGQALAEAEGEVVDIRQRGITEINRGQLTHTLHTVSLDGRQSTSRLKSNTLQIVTSVEHVCRYALQKAVCGKRDGFQLGTAAEHVLAHGGYRGGHAEGGETAIGKGTVADTGQCGILTEGYGVQIPVILKGVLTDLSQAVGEGDGGQGIVAGKGILLNADQAFRQGVSRYVPTVEEALLLYRFHRLGEINLRKIPGALKGRVSYRYSPLGDGEALIGPTCGVGQ